MAIAVVSSNSPVAGDIWIVQDLPANTLPEAYGSISRFFESWDDLNGRKVKITKHNPSRKTWGFIEIETGGECTGISRRFFNERADLVFVRKECCQPSVALCEECKVEFINEMVDKGKRYDRWQKTWK
jgi:hypothetical protein